MDKIKLIVDKACGLKNEHYECEYPTSELNLFDSIIIYRKDNLHATNK